MLTDRHPATLKDRLPFGGARGEVFSGGSGGEPPGIDRYIVEHIADLHALACRAPRCASSKLNLKLAPYMATSRNLYVEKVLFPL